MNTINKIKYNDNIKKLKKVWKEKDVTLEAIKDKTIAIIGYGIQGQAQACNLKDSGINVIIGLRDNSSSRNLAIRDGHKIRNISQAATEADIIYILIPDMQQGHVYKNNIGPHLSEKKILCFSHGASIYYNWINLPHFVDVIMVAPKGPGEMVRNLFVKEFGILSLVAVHQDYSQKALEIALAISKGIGSTRAGVIMTNFKEVETDWFGEQVDLCGGVHSMIVNAFDTLVEAGYQPEIAYFECLHELKLTVDLIFYKGITGMYNGVSEIAKYGGFTRGDKILDANSKNRMKKVLEEIQSGVFAKELKDIYAKDKKELFCRHMNKIENLQIEKTGKELREIIFKKD